MSLLRKFFFRKPPDGLIELCERVYVFDCCFSTEALDEESYKAYTGNIFNQFRDFLPDASFLVFNFREGETQSEMAKVLSEYDMTIMDYPRQFEGCPVLKMELVHHFLRSSESWLSLGQQNVLLMHCERGGWPVLAFMLAALLIYRKQYSGEQKTLDMVYKMAPNELLHLLTSLTPFPSQLRYLQYVSRRNIVASEWPPQDRSLRLDCIMLRFIPDFGNGGCRPLFRIYGQDPVAGADQAPKVLHSTPKRNKPIRTYKQEESELVKIDINCLVQGDVVVECVSMNDDMQWEEMMFRFMFNTAFIRSNILILNPDEVDMLWDARDKFPKNFKAEILFSEMDAATSIIRRSVSLFEEKEGLPEEAFAKVQEFFSHVDWLDLRADAALNALQQMSVSPHTVHEKSDNDSHKSAETGVLQQLQKTSPKEDQKKMNFTKSDDALPENLEVTCPMTASLGVSNSTVGISPEPLGSNSIFLAPLTPCKPRPLQPHLIGNTISPSQSPPPPPPPAPLQPYHISTSELENSSPRKGAITLSQDEAQTSKTSSSTTPGAPTSTTHFGNISSSPPSSPTIDAIIPPPPAPFLSRTNSSSNGGKGRLLRTISSKNNKKLKPLHWMKITRATQGSLWAEAPKYGENAIAPEIDMSELESLFSAALPNLTNGRKSMKRGSVGSKPEKVQLIDHRRAYNCEIMLSKVKVPLHVLMNSVLSLEDSALDVDQVENLIKFCPTKEEMELLKAYTGEKEKLGRCEQFFLELMQVPRVESKLRVYSFKIQFRSQISDLRNSLNIVNSATEEIRNSNKLKRIMQTILSLGNALNQGTARGSAIGFKLDSLLKLTETRARNNKMTLMHYLCKVFADKLPEVLDFSKDLGSLEPASKIQLKILAEEMQAISKGLEEVVQELSTANNDSLVLENFCKTLKEFLQYAEAEVRSLASLYSAVGRNADAMILYFGEDLARCSYEQVVSTLLNFTRMFNQAHRENCKQLELEAKKAAESKNIKIVDSHKRSEEYVNV
uniref:Formin-like protein n=1 Tax=Cannabis sativa TaxID=3483 RepID=A0A803QB16_CANSA